MFANIIYTYHMWYDDVMENLIACVFIYIYINVYIYIYTYVHIIHICKWLPLWLRW